MKHAGIRGHVSAALRGVLLTSLQRPLANSGKKTSEASSNIRLLWLDIAKVLAARPGAIQQLIHVIDCKANRGTWISYLFSLSLDTVLTSERRTNKVFKVALAGITPVSRTSVVDRASIVALDANNGKLERLSLSGGDMVLCPDNDFDLPGGIRQKVGEGAAVWERFVRLVGHSPQPSR